MKTLQTIAVGDTVHRYLGGTIHMPMTVLSVDDGKIVCSVKEFPIAVDAAWTFDQATGAEVDEELGWGPPPKRTGSFILAEPKE